MKGATTDKALLSACGETTLQLHMPPLPYLTVLLVLDLKVLEHQMVHVKCTIFCEKADMSPKCGLTPFYTPMCRAMEVCKESYVQSQVTYMLSPN